MKIDLFLSSLAFLFISESICAQKGIEISSQLSAWTASLDEVQKVFIENKGQFLGHVNCGAKIDSVLFAVTANGLNVYFSPKGITYQHLKIQDDLEEKERERGEVVADFMDVEFAGVDSSSLQIIGELKTSYHFIYAGPEGNMQSSIQARTFRRLVYKNIYPNIDIEYTFPENKAGIKYAIILRPGGDPSRIKIKYKGAQKMYSDSELNMRIESKLGEFIDHAPETFYENGTNIKSRFILNNNTVSFELGNYDHSKTVIIDPWTSLPLFTNSTSAYDIDWDYFGNIYVHGGYFANQLLKFNSSGAIQWLFTTQSILQNFGDFTIDRFTGTAYICESYHPPGARLLKLNTLGTQLAVSANNPNNTDEYWRISYNSCTGKGVIAAGGTTSTYQACTFDTNLNVQSQNVLSATKSFYDIGLLAVDDTNCYMSTQNSAVSPNIFDNLLLKCPLPGLLPPAYMVPTGHGFPEGIIYYQSAPAYNGMAKGSKSLYTYNGNKLKKWNPWSGKCIDSVMFSGFSFHSGGVAVDACDNVYVGYGKSVRKYDSTLTFITSINTIGRVCDVAIGLGNELLACGDSFVSVLPFYACTSSFSLSTAATVAVCPNNNGTATVMVSGGNPPYSYCWMPGGQTTATATGLAGGIYHATVFDSNDLSCTIKVPQTATVVVVDSSGLSLIPTSVPECLGAGNGSSSVSVFGGTPAYSYVWSSGQSSQIATGLTSGMYTVLVTDGNGCKDSIVTNVAVLPNPAASVLGTTPIFQGQTTSLIASGGENYLWSTGESDSILVVAPTWTTVYCVMVSDTNNCKDTACITIEVKSPCDTAGTFYLANAFSPNGDGENDLLKIYYTNPDCIQSLHFVIYEYWGEKVFESSDPKFEWDGKYLDRIMQISVLVYHLNVEFTNGEIINRKGNISLVR